MSDEKGVVEALYDNFLLRDLFGKIVPGSIVVAVAAYHRPELRDLIDFAKDLGWPAALLAAGLVWIVGFGVQEIGEITGIMRHHPRDCDDRDLRYQKRLRFHKVASSYEVRQLERYAIIKEASGNGATALVLAAVIGAIRSILPEFGWQTASFYVGLLAVLCVALVLANREHGKKQFGLQDRVLKEQPEPWDTP